MSEVQTQAELPIELYSEILKNVSTLPDLVRLCMTNKAYNTVCKIKGPLMTKLIHDNSEFQKNFLEEIELMIWSGEYSELGEMLYQWYPINLIDEAYVQLIESTINLLRNAPPTTFENPQEQETFTNVLLITFIPKARILLVHETVKYMLEFAYKNFSSENYELFKSLLLDQIHWYKHKHDYFTTIAYTMANEPLSEGEMDHLYHLFQVVFYRDPETIEIFKNAFGIDELVLEDVYGINHDFLQDLLQFTV